MPCCFEDHPTHKCADCENGWRRKVIYPCATCYGDGNIPLHAEIAQCNWTPKVSPRPFMREK